MVHGEIADRLKTLLHEKADALGVTIEGLEVMPNHVHLVVTLDEERLPAPRYHKTARTLVSRYGTVVHGAVHIRGIARSRFTKSTLDVAWEAFLSILAHKAEEAGVTVIAVPPHHTTQLCSRCEKLPLVFKTLVDRVHRCVYCGYVTDRDLNAAQHILRLGSSLQDKTGADRQRVS